jgi:CBS domain-containing protein
MLVRDAMTRGAETISPGESLREAARRMKAAGVGALVVTEQDRIVGILTDRDIVVRSTAEGTRPAEADVRSAMTPQVIDCREDEALEEAATRMARGAVRRVVVVDGDQRVVGLLSVDDLALRSPALAGEVLEHVREPERPGRRGPWPWWETPES